jgi:UDP-N-acetylmuramate--alanine ligase
LAAIGVALKLDINIDVIKTALKHFEGVKRRFTKIAEVGGVTLIDDYAHHPVEIAAVLKGARNVTDGKIVAVWQPHRYSRAKTLFSGFCTAFNDADAVIVTDIYPAGEAAIEGINKEYMANGITTCGHRDVTVASSFDEIPALIAGKVKQGDLVIFLGAGNISSAAYKMVNKLKELI